MADDKRPDRSRTSSRKNTEDPFEQPADDLDLSSEDEGAGAAARPVAVSPTGSPTTPAPEGAPAEDQADLVERPDVEPADPAASPDGSDEPEWTGVEPAASSSGMDPIERPGRELGVGGLAAAVAILVFFPWYSNGGSFEPTGWSSGTWGPIVFFLSLAAVATVALRRFNVPIRFPVHHAIVLEVLGWVIVGMLLIKRFARPGLAPQATIWLTVTLFAALGLALAGGSVSQGVTVVVRPGWFRDTAGKLGVGVITAALVVGAGFGLLNDASVGTPGGGPNTAFSPGFPECASNVGVPIPDGVTAVSGSSQTAGFCIASLETDLKANKTIANYAKAFKENGWKIRFDSRRAKDNPQANLGIGQIQAQKGRDCAAVTVQPALSGQDRARVTLVIGPPDSVCNLGKRLEETRPRP